MSARWAISTVLVAAPALGGVVLKMPPPPAAAPAVKAVPSPSTSVNRVTPLQRFVSNDPARDHAGDVILLTIPESSSDGAFAEWSSPRWGGWGGTGPGYGWYGYGWGWGSPIIINDYCGSHRPFPVRSGHGYRNSGMVFEAGFVLGY
ncbi:MAG: hypothetical protein QF561_02960 [Phycisphaerales bacterium]|jgi:hypothetical protein|nr:hypothetical protein [Phycisphaerales bacterium]